MKVEKVHLKEVVLDSVERDDALPGAYSFDIQLQNFADPVWIEIFMSVHEHEPDPGPIEGLEVRSNKIRVIATPGNEQHCVDSIKLRVDKANILVEKHNQRLALEAEKQAKQTQDRAVELKDARERLKNITI